MVLNSSTIYTRFFFLFPSIHRCWFQCTLFMACAQAFALIGNHWLKRPLRKVFPQKLSIQFYDIEAITHTHPFNDMTNFCVVFFSPFLVKEFFSWFCLFCAFGRERERKREQKLSTTNANRQAFIMIWSIQSTRTFLNFNQQQMHKLEVNVGLDNKKTR